MATRKGVLQGYTGVAAVDSAHQIIVDAHAHGTGSEQELLMPMITAVQSLRNGDTLITADAGYQSEANLQQLAALRVPALIADNAMRRRDARFATQVRYTVLPNPLHNKSASPRIASPVVSTVDFVYDAEARTCTCPAGTSLYRKGRANITQDYIGEHFRGAKRDCMPCTLRNTCLRTPKTTAVRNVAVLRGRVDPDALEPRETHTMRMKARIDTPLGRAQYGRRFATVEPVFANLPHNKRLDRVTRRGRAKVDAQWKLYCLVHNIEQLAHAGYAASTTTPYRCIRARLPTKKRRADGHALFANVAIAARTQMGCENDLSYNLNADVLKGCKRSNQRERSEPSEHACQLQREVKRHRRPPPDPTRVARGGA